MNNSLKEIFKQDLAGIIYDCDGVMIDSAEANRYLYNRIMEIFGQPRLTPEQEKFAFQATFQHALKALIPAEFHARLEAEVPGAVDYDKDVLPKIKLMPGYRDFIERAHAMGLRQGIDTNRTDFGIAKVLDRFELPSFLNPVISSSDAAPKPSPDGVNMILKAWGAAPQEVLFVGDSEDDKKAAKLAHTFFASFNNFSLEADITIVSWNELAEMLWAPNPDSIQ